MPANLRNSAVATGLGKVSFHSKAMAKNVQTTAQLHLFLTLALMFKILQARLLWYMNHELPDVQAGFRKGRGTGDQIANIHWIIKKAREFQKNVYFCFIDYAKTFDSLDHNELWTILKVMEISDHLTCLLRNLYACQEATVRTGHGTTDKLISYTLIQNKKFKVKKRHVCSVLHLEINSKGRI